MMIIMIDNLSYVVDDEDRLALLLLWNSLDCCMILATTLLALDILSRHFSLIVLVHRGFRGFGDYALYKSTFYSLFLSQPVNLLHQGPSSP